MLSTNYRQVMLAPSVRNPDLVDQMCNDNIQLEEQATLQHYV